MKRVPGFPIKRTRKRKKDHVIMTPQLREWLAKKKEQKL